MIPTGKPSVRTEVLAAPPAVAANAARFAEPRDADARPDGEALAPRPQLLDDTDDLMTGGDPGVPGREIAFAHMQIGSTNPTGLDANQNLAFNRNRHVRLDRPKRIRFDRGRLCERHRPHQCHRL